MVLILLQLCRPFFGVENQATSIGTTWPWFLDSSLVMTFWRKSGSLVAVWIKSLATAARCSFCSGSRSRRTNFATTHFTPRSCVKISYMVVFGIPTSAPSSYTVGHWSLLIAAHTCSTFSGVLLVAGLPERGSLSTILEHLWSICATLLFALYSLHCLRKPLGHWIVSMEEYSSLTQNLMQIRCSTHSVILNVTVTQYTCSLSGIYCPYWLVQWSRHCSHMRIPVHSPWGPGYIDVVLTVLIILTMAALFWHWPHIF